MQTYLRRLTLIVVVATAWLAVAAVDLVTLPTREGTRLTVYNSEDITMVREHRQRTTTDWREPCSESCAHSFSSRR
jgi:hypothetical protein